MTLPLAIANMDKHTNFRIKEPNIYTSYNHILLAEKGVYKSQVILLIRSVLKSFSHVRIGIKLQIISEA